MQGNTAKRLTASIVVIIILTVCLTVTSFALGYANYVLKENRFETGLVAINLNDGNPIIEEGEIAFAPGDTVKKTFFIENTGTGDVWFRLVFRNVEGTLADTLTVTIADHGTVLYQGAVKDLTKKTPQAPRNEKSLSEGELRELTIEFHFPEEAGDEYQSASLRFDLVADAVQAKNNPGRRFSNS